ncbi:alpha/beta hydrolase [Candidatus Woesearchaeota archaeon]|nr:alpha/beta hydrolase [Candidatus Woesearchaeota archaeon]
MEDIDPGVKVTIKDKAAQAIAANKYDIIEQYVFVGKVRGSVFFKKNTKPNRGLLVSHGIGGNRYCLTEFARRLASYGFFVLSIDLPSHYLNTNKLSLGEISETMIEGTILLRQYGMRYIAVIAHSLGAVGALFSRCGYTAEIENNIYPLWENTIKLMEQIGEDTYDGIQDYDKNRKIVEQIEANYAQMKELVFYSLRNSVKKGWNVDCYVLLAPPPEAKKAVPWLKVLRKLKPKWQKALIEKLFHKPLVKLTMEEGNIVKFVPEKDVAYTNWLFFKIKDVPEFLDYLMGLKEPGDFLELVEKMGQFRRKDQKITFFEYYLKKYLIAPPKLFVYGKWDAFLRTMIPSTRKRIEKFYLSCGDAEIQTGEYVHSFLEDPKAWRSVSKGMTNPEVFEIIVKFLEKHMQR